jgi:feruloyl esterase
MAAAVAEGYATSGTDTGHPEMGAKFALGHPEKVKDFGWRAVHDMTVETKVLVKAFYGRAAEHSYFTSCSDGGREALMEAQRFPKDFDGILAGAPAYNWTALISAATEDEKTLMASAGAYLPANKLPAITAAALAACDAQDGLKDGVVGDPAKCGFDPAVLACAGAETDGCLTPGQVATLKEIYAAKRDAQGREVFPGYSPGAESAPGSWGVWIVGKKQGDATAMMYFGLGYFKDFVFEQPDWSLGTFDFDRDSEMALAKTGEALNATDTNLKPFAARGGKLLMYHGWNDPAIPALSSVEYYDGVVASMGKKATEAAVRLYMVPGMLHCGGGPGAADFGQDGDAARGDAQHDVFTALEQWVEAGKGLGTGPGTLTATKFADDDETKGVVMTRPVCVYPAEARYVKGDPKDAASFVCVGQ